MCPVVGRNICEVIECDKYVVTHGLCDKHRKRFARHGHTEQTRANDWGKRENHPLYTIWMQHRRFNSKHPLSKELYLDFWEFANSITVRPSKSFHLQPLDKDQPITKANHHWVEALAHVPYSDEKKAYAKWWAKEDRKRNPDKYKNQSLLKQYGISLHEYNELHKAQNGKCAICGNGESEKINGRELSLAVDHCHTTGNVRGLLCNKCNQGLGCFKDDIELIQKVLTYLK